MKYRRLPGKKRGLGSWRSLWIGDDHLLSVDSNGYSEQYTRYYFKDIKAFFTRRTVSGKIWNAVLGAGSGIFLLAALASLAGGDSSFTSTMSFFFAMFIVALLVNVLLGPTCRCHILMPLGIQELPTLRRVRRARKALDLIRSGVERTQAPLRPEELAALPESSPSRPIYPVADERVRRTPTVAGPVPDYRGGAHYAAFSLLISEAILGMATLAHGGNAILVACLVLTLTLFGCLVAAVVKQYASPVPALARRLVWVAIGVLTGAIISGYYLGIFLSAINSRGKAGPQTDIAAVFGAISAQGFFPYFVAVCSLCLAVIGALGLLSCLRWRGESGVAAPDNHVTSTEDAAT